MTKEVKLKPVKAVKKEVKKEPVAKKEATEKKIGTPQDPEELKKVLSEEEINVANSKTLRHKLKDVSHNDLIGYIILFNDHETGRVGVLSSIDQAVSQFVALAHGGYIDQYDQIINQVITTRTIERMQQGIPKVEAKPPPPQQIKESNEPEAEAEVTPKE